MNQVDSAYNSAAHPEPLKRPTPSSSSSCRPGGRERYAAIAPVDAKAQIIVAAQAHGSGSEQSVLLPMVQKTDGLRTDQTIITADAGYHSENNLKALPDPLRDKTATAGESSKRLAPSDFQYDSATNRCICPAGKKLYSTGSHCTTHGRLHHKFQGPKRDCVPCILRGKCLRHPERTQTRQVAFFAKNQFLGLSGIYHSSNARRPK